MIKVMRKFAVSVMIFSAVSACAYAGGAGSTAVLTLLEPVSGADAAMGEAGVALSGSPSMLRYNPAGIISSGPGRAGFLYRRGLADDSYFALTASLGGGDITYAASVQYYTTGEITLFNLAGQEVTEVGQRDTVFNLGAATEIGGIPAGVNLKYITSEIFGEDGSAFAADLGMQYKEFEGMTLGLAVRNLGTGIEYVSDEEDLPLNVAAGASYSGDHYGGDLLLSMEVPYFVNEKETLILAGAEFIYNGMLALRGGYRVNLDDTSGEDVPVTLGVGIIWNNYLIDYGVGLASDLSSPHNISVTLLY